MQCNAMFAPVSLATLGSELTGPTWFRRLYLALAAGGRVVALAEDQLTRGAPLARPGRAVPAGQLREHSFALLPSENWQYEN